MTKDQRAALQAKTEAIRAEKALKHDPSSFIVDRTPKGVTIICTDGLCGRMDCPRCQGRKPAAPTPEPLSEKPKKPKRPWTPRQNDRAIQAKGRLPDGARFTAVYDAANMLWHGMLEIPEAPTVSGRASGIFQLLHELDDQWRAHLKAQEGQK